MITVHLYGSYRRQFGAKFKMHVSSFVEAIRLLDANFPGKFVNMVNGDKFHVARGRKIGQHINIETEEQLKLQSSDGSHFHLIPAVIGAATGNAANMKMKGLGAIILGAVILGASFFFGFTPGIYAGLALIAGGASLLLAPDIAAKNEDKQTNHAFSGPVNVTTQGATKPIVYGRHVTGSVVAAGSIKSTTVPKNVVSSGGGGGGK